MYRIVFRDESFLHFRFIPFWREFYKNKYISNFSFSLFEISFQRKDMFDCREVSFSITILGNRFSLYHIKQKR